MIRGDPRDAADPGEDASLTGEARRDHRAHPRFYQRMKAALPLVSLHAAHDGGVAVGKVRRPVPL